MQKDELEKYLSGIHAGELPVKRALVPTPHQRFIREWILQMKEGHLGAQPFRDKFGTDPLKEFATPLANQQSLAHNDRTFLDPSHASGQAATCFSPRFSHEHDH